MKQLMILILALTLPALASAHEGHDKAPGAVSAPHGGLVSGASHIDLELVTTDNGIKIYPFDSEMKPIPLDQVKMQGTATFPRKGKSVAVKFAKDADAYAAQVDAKGANRYALEVTVTHQGKTEKVKFNVEPR